MKPEPTSRDKARATAILNTKTVRTYLIAHPGSTAKEILAATGFGVGCLQEMGLAYWKRDKETKIVKWYPKTGNVVARPWVESYTN